MFKPLEPELWTRQEQPELRAGRRLPTVTLPTRACARLADTQQWRTVQTQHY
jgi:hypothetical protein